MIELSENSALNIIWAVDPDTPMNMLRKACELYQEKQIGKYTFVSILGWLFTDDRAMDWCDNLNDLDTFASMIMRQP